jgi:hypothetical protein
VRKLEEERQRLGDEEPAVELRAQFSAKLVQPAGVADDHELRRRSFEPVEQRPHDAQLDVLEARVLLSLRREARDVQLVVDVTVQPVARGLDRLDPLACELERDRHVAEERTRRRIRDDRALVADDRLGTGQVAAHGLEHASDDITSLWFAARVRGRST